MQCYAISRIMYANTAVYPSETDVNECKPKKGKLIERKKLQPLVLSHDLAENAKYAEKKEGKGIGGNHVSDTREAWPFV